MSKFVYLDARVFTRGADLSGVSNKVEISGEREAKDVTNFRSAGFKEFIAGLGSATVNAEGFWETGDPAKVDDAAWEQIGGVGPWTVCPTDAIDGARAFLVNALETNYAPLQGSVGEVAGYKANAVSTWPLVRGLVLNPPGTARTASGTGTARQLGAVAAGQRLYASLHVVSVSGTTPSMTVEIESDNAVGFPSPTTQLTFTAATAVGGQILRSAGTAIADDWFRVKYTISGTTPSFLAVVAVGIA